MTENKKKKTKKQLSRPALILIIGICIILIPCLIFGGIILTAAINTGNPIFGDRYKGDLDPAITDEDIESLKTSIASLSDVEKVDIALTSGQLRINIDAKDSITNEDAEALLDSAYDKVDAKLAISKYFTSTSDKKMYDLAINVYNKIDAEDESMIYYILTKNAMMEEAETQCVSEAVDEELASDLRGENLPDETAEPTADPQNEVE